MATESVYIVLYKECGQDKDTWVLDLPLKLSLGTQLNSVNLTVFFPLT